MIRHWSDGEREIWNEMQRDAMPTVSFHKTTTHEARKPWTCDTCRKERPAGTRYIANAMMEDGKFVYWKHCQIDPNGDCPLDYKTWEIVLERDPNVKPKYSGDPRTWQTRIVQRITAGSRETIRDYAESIANSTEPYDYQIVSVNEIKQGS